jgi:hypothetical protein
VTIYNSWKLNVGLIVALLAIGAEPASAAEGGYSNYIPGTYGDFAVALAPETKFTFRDDVYYYEADGGRSVRAGSVDVEADLEFLMNLTTFLYQPGVELFGAKYAFGALVPIVHADIKAKAEAAGVQASVRDDTLGLGDVTLIPWVLFWDWKNVHLSFAEYIVTPTSRYDEDDLANPGLNYWSFDTNIAVTYLNPETGRELSANIGYIYNTENPDTDYQTGQELHIDYMFNQYLSEKFAIGLQGFYLKQVTGDSGDGALLGSFKGEAAGIGPAVLWNTKIGGSDVSFIAKWLHEYHAERRIEGNHFMLSFALGF